MAGLAREERCSVLARSAAHHNGTRVWQGACASTPEAIAHTLQKNAPNATCIGFETGAPSTWHWHALNDMGLPPLMFPSL